MCPASTNNLVLEVETSTDEEVSRALVVNLQRNLNSSGALRASNAKADDIGCSSLSETKGDGILLYTLLLAFIQSGAAKSLIDAIGAMFASSKHKDLRLTLRINHKCIQITPEDVKGETADSLVKRIETEVANQ
jgi:hypothetical protein